MTEKRPIITAFTKNDFKIFNHQEPFELTYTWLLNMIEEANESALNALYEEYLKSGVDKMFVIDKAEFKKFLMKYIPIYMEEKENA